MDLTVRDWLIVIGGLLAVAVLLDGYRRMRKDRQDAIRLSSRRRRDDVDDDITNPELPGGSARVVAVREAPQPKKPSLHEKRAGLDRSRDQVAPAPVVDEDIDAEEDFDDDILFRDPGEEYGGLEAEGDVADVTAEQRLEPEFGNVGEDSDTEPMPPQESDSVVETEDLTAGLSARRDDRVAAFEPPPEVAASRRKDKQDEVTTNEADDEKPEYQELLVLNVVAPTDKPFNGSEMLQILLACDVRYGKMNIFHRYEKADGTGAVQFSIANLVEPGDFELDGIEEFTTPGLVFFMHLPGPEKSIKAFDAMVETARCLVSNLGGELRDQTHSVATKQTLEHYRQRIRDFERRQLTLM
jgi:cell division protein ZipA